MLPFFFGGSEQCPGQLRTYVSPRASGYQDLRGDAPVQMITIDPESLAPDAAGSDAVRAETASLAGEIARYARGAERIFVDLPTASGATLRRVMPLAPTILVPMIPDVASVVSVDSIDAFCARYSPRSQRVLPYYVLNQFDDSLALHLDVREMLSQRLGSRLLPFVLNRAPLVSEALAEGMTVIDYAPHSAVAEEFGNLAGWVRSFTAARATESGNVRWSER
jgi:cellulose biosynthesis protein BcsQ